MKSVKRNVSVTLKELKRITRKVPPEGGGAVDTGPLPVVRAGAGVGGCLPGLLLGEAEHEGAQHVAQGVGSIVPQQHPLLHLHRHSGSLVIRVVN